MASTDDILNAALSLFNQRGYRQVTVDDIAHKRGISKRTLYQHFESKEDIAKQVVLRELAMLGDTVDEISKDDSLDFVAAFTNILSAVQRAVGGFSLTFLEDIERYAPSVFQLIVDFRTNRILFLTALFRRSQEEGTVRPEINPEWAAKFLILIANQFVRPEFLQREEIPLRQAIDLVREIFLYGIANLAEKE